VCANIILQLRPREDSTLCRGIPEPHQHDTIETWKDTLTVRSAIHLSSVVSMALPGWNYMGNLTHQDASKDICRQSPSKHSNPLLLGYAV
jgi:hypothetical protein